jgi:hypothetical protein
VTDAAGSRSSYAPSTWEYLIVALPPFKAAAASQGGSESVAMLNREGAQGWEAVGMTVLDNGAVAVLMKRRSVAAA